MIVPEVHSGYRNSHMYVHVDQEVH